MTFSPFTVDMLYFFAVVWGDVMRALAAAGVAAAVLYAVVLMTVNVLRYE
jgi:hypothetical protein